MLVEDRQIGRGLLLLTHGAIPMDAAVVILDPVGEAVAQGGGLVPGLFQVAAAAGMQLVTGIFTAGSHRFRQDEIMAQGSLDIPVVVFAALGTGVTGVALLRTGGSDGLAGAVGVFQRIDLLGNGDILSAAAGAGVNIIAIVFAGSSHRFGQLPFVHVARFGGNRGRLRGRCGSGRFCGRLRGLGGRLRDLGAGDRRLGLGSGGRRAAGIGIVRFGEAFEDI